MRPPVSQSDSQRDPRVHVSLADLAGLEFRARGFSFLPRQPVHSVLAGRRSSRLRGRGLNFEEIRGYLPGDDIRNIDWKVTARTRKPHVRVYTEERDRPAILVVDQRGPMFFGTQRYMKSVTAAHVAALIAWRVFHSGDRVGAIVFNDSEIREIRPHRSRSRVLEILGAIAQQNQALPADSAGSVESGMLDRALTRATHLAGHDNFIGIVSDFAGAGDETRRQVLNAVRHNDVVATLVFDPAAERLPNNGRLVVSQGELQVEWDLGDRQVRDPLSSFFSSRLQQVDDFLTKLAIPVLRVQTGDEAIDQVRHILGHLGGAAGGARRVR